jgi:hypothetical protein
MRSYTLVVSEIAENRVVYNKGILITDLTGDPVKLADGTRYTDAQHRITEFSLGKRWTARHRLVKPNGSAYDSEIAYRVVARERITVPAGSFEAFHVEGVGWSKGDKVGVDVVNQFWISPEVRRYIVHESRTRFASGKLSKHERYELTGYAQR